MVACLVCGNAMRPDGEQSFRRLTKWWHCDRCDFGQVDPMPSAEQVTSYYASGEYRREVNTTTHPEWGDGDSPQEGNYHEERERARVWLPHLTLPVQAHLDVGSSTGKVLEVIGAKIQVGVEPGPWRRYYQSQERLEDVEGAFDLVTIFHTLEHVSAPLAMLRAVKLLASHKVCVEVPPPKARMWPHLLDWSGKSLLLAMDTAGLPATLISDKGALRAVASVG